MRRIAVSAPVDLPPERALALWTDLRRWPVFVEGFQAVVSGGREWPEPGARLIWQSTPGGRGRVTERVAELRPGERIVTEVFEQRLVGTQSASFAPPGADAPAGTGAVAELALEYELAEGGALKGVVDLLFIRRALRDALGRTLRRFAIEAAEDATLGA